MENNNKNHPYLSDVRFIYKKIFKAVIVFSFFINILMLAVPIYLIQIYDKIIPNNSSDTLFFISGVVIFALAVLAALELLRSRVLARLAVWFSTKLGGHLLGSSMSSAAKSSNSGSVNTLKDLVTLRNFTTSPAVITLLDLPWVPLYIGILFFIHVWIGFVVLMGALVLFSLAIINELSTRTVISNTDEASNKTVDVATSYVRNADAIAAMGMGEQMTQRWRQQQQVSLSKNYDVDKQRAKTNAVIKFIRLLLQVVVIGLAAMLILKGELTSGATIASILLMRNAISPLERSINAWRSVLTARTAYKRINDALRDAPELKTIQGIQLSKGLLKVSNVRYRYFGERHSLFFGVSFQVQPGEAIALVGASAAGKSTLSKLLIGIYKPTSGTVSLDGQNIANCDSEILGKHIGYLPQTIELFAGTVKENIARMQQVNNAEEVIEAAQLVGIHDVLLKFSKGYDTEIGDDGAYLSGGQRQRIGLARAVYGKPWLLVLDEPDAHLDTKGKAALVIAINKLKSAGAIIIVITHHEDIHKFVDKVYDLDKKKLRSRSKSMNNNVININATTRGGAKL